MIILTIAATATFAAALSCHIDLWYAGFMVPLWVSVIISHSEKKKKKKKKKKKEKRKEKKKVLW
jgi:4-hydroxybenzoate polyprenyltransferase